MKHARRQVGSILAGLALAVFSLPVLTAPAHGQDAGTVRVLVAPLQTSGGLDRDFGHDVAEEVRDRIGDMSGMRVVDEDDVEDALDRFDLDEDALSMVEWRQLAGRLNAQMLMYGEAAPADQGVRVTVRFIDPSAGDELEVPEFTVDRNAGQVADRISEGLSEQVEYGRAVVFCNEYLGSEQFEDALRNCDSALEVNPNSSRALYQRGRVYMEMERWEEAREDLQRVVEASPSNTDALQSLAYTEAQLGNSERAQELYREYLTFNPDDAQVRLNVAYNLAREGFHREAMVILEDGIERDSTNAALWEYLGNVALAAGTSSQSAAQEGPAEAGPGAEQMPTDGEGTAQPQNGVVDSAAVRTAVEAYDRVLELRGDSINPAILTQVIAANLALGDTDAALEFSDRALETIRSGDAMIGGDQQAAGGGADGEGQAEAGTGEEAGTEAGTEAAGDTVAAGDTTAAEGEAQVPDQAPQRSREELLASIHAQRAQIFARQEQFGRAVEEMNEALDLQPDLDQAYMRRGFYTLRQGNTDAAIEDFRRAVEEQGADSDQVAQAIFGRGYQNYFQQGEYSTAIDMFEAALEFAEQPDVRNQTNFFIAYGHYQLGTAIDQRNQEAEACQPARNALQQFRQVAPYLERSGNYQPNSQSQISEAVDTQIYRQEQIIRASCG